jgi:hypothetical protein
MELIYRPLSDFPKEFESDDRAWSNPFKAQWPSTLNLLERELEHLGATWCVIELAVRESDIKLAGGLKAHVTPAHNGVVLSFDSEHGDLRYGTNKFPQWRTNVRAIALALEKLRAIDRYGVGGKGEQYKGWAELPETATGGMTREDARSILDAYGGEAAALKATHPDTRREGVTDEDFHRVQIAREVLHG